MFILVSTGSISPFGRDLSPWQAEFIRKFLYSKNLNSPFVKKEQDAFHDESNPRIPGSLGKRDISFKPKPIRTNLSVATTPRQKLICNFTDKNRESKKEFKEIDFKQNGDLLEIDILGSYYGELPEENAYRLRDELDKIFESIKSKEIDAASVLINMHNVDFVSSDTLGFLIKLYKGLLSHGLRLELAGLGQSAKEVFKTTRLDSFLEIYQGSNTLKAKFRLKELRLANVLSDSEGLVFKLRSKEYKNETSGVLCNDFEKLADLIKDEKTISIDFNGVKYIDVIVYNALEKLEQKLKDIGCVLVVSDLSEGLKNTRFGKLVCELVRQNESVLNVC